MRVITVGSLTPETKRKKKKPKSTWSDLNLDDWACQLINTLNPNTEPRAVQRLAFGEHYVLQSRRNLIVSAPTNSGKSLISTMILLDCVRRGSKAVLLEPLKALAREKFDEIREILPQIESVLGRKIKVRITTGDYRVDNEYFFSPPPDDGELIIATPERIEAILRNPDSKSWFETIGAVCIDEAHLIGSARRGPTLEYLMTSLISLDAPPRLVLLSASLGNVERIQEWLAPCDVIVTVDREPELSREVIELSEAEDANSIVAGLVQKILTDPAKSVLVFVYQTAATEFLAGELNRHLQTKAGIDGVLAYHSKMSEHKRDATRKNFITGNSRCLVTTTSLALGVNLPCTDVIVRDCTFAGVGSLSVSEILQMMGRAGRGQIAGRASVIVRPSDRWKAEGLADALQTGNSESLGSAFDCISAYREQPDEVLLVAVATQTAMQIGRASDGGASAVSISGFFERSLGGITLSNHVVDAIAWLSEPSRALAYSDEDGKYKLTRLAEKALRSTFPLDKAAGLGQLIRDLLTIGGKDFLLSKWSPLDHLIVIELLADSSPHLRSFGASMVEQIDAWIEAAPGRSSLLYSSWIRGERGTSRADELLGSLNIGNGRNNDKANSSEFPYKRSHLAVYRAIVLYERSMGTSIDDVARVWRARNLPGVEERWRDQTIWLLSAASEILDLPCFYHHLIEECSFSKEDIQTVKRQLIGMRQSILELLDRLKYCSPLGAFFTSMRHYYKSKGRSSPGHKTMDTLERAGIRTVDHLLRLSEEDIIEIGVSKRFAKKIISYISLRTLS